MCSLPSRLFETNHLAILHNFRLVRRQLKVVRLTKNDWLSTDISYEYTMRLSADGQRMNGEAVEEDGSVTELRWTRQ